MTPTSAPSLLHVSELAWGEIVPTAVVVHTTLVASKLFSGRAALTNAEELRRLVTALVKRGLREDAIALEGASLDISTGMFSKSSSVTYRVRIRVSDLDRLPDVLDAITDCKDAAITYLEWDYTSASSVVELLAECATRAIAKAHRLASALGVSIAGIQTVEEEQLTEPASHAMTAAYGAGMPMMARARRTASVASELAGLDLAPRKQVGVRVKLAYRIAGAS
jgi:uncharacterized protein YggE